MQILHYIDSSDSFCFKIKRSEAEDLLHFMQGLRVQFDKLELNREAPKLSGPEEVSPHIAYLENVLKTFPDGTEGEVNISRAEIVTVFYALSEVYKHPRNRSSIQSGRFGITGSQFAYYTEVLFDDYSLWAEKNGKIGFWGELHPMGVKSREAYYRGLEFWEDCLHSRLRTYRRETQKSREAGDVVRAQEFSDKFNEAMRVLRRGFSHAEESELGSEMLKFVNEHRQHWENLKKNK